MNPPIKEFPPPGPAPSGGAFTGGEDTPAFSLVDDDAAPDAPPPPEQVGARGPRLTARRIVDAQTMAPRRGASRAVAVVLSLLAVAGTGAGGGYHVWKTEFTRPSLVRSLPPAPAAQVTTLRGAGAAVGMAGALTPEEEEGLQAPPASGISIQERSQGSPGAFVAGRLSLKGEGWMTPPTPGDLAPAPPGSAPASRRPGRVLSDRQEFAVGHSEWGSGSGPRPRPAPPTVKPLAQAPAGSRAVGSAQRVTPRADAAPRPDSGPGIEIRKRVRADHVAASLERAYDAFQSGDVESAAQAYQSVLGDEPRNRDALLGLAAVAARAGRWGEAAAHYARVIAFNPADIVARAALIAIDEQDLVRGESRLKTLLSSEPRAAYLHFSLGNVYAAQSRWPEARQSYFNAWQLDSENADYAYNLAVSLDHLSHPEGALDFYREALTLAQQRRANFETAAVTARIRDLTTP